MTGGLNRATIQVATRAPNEILDITPQVERAIGELGIRDGFVLLYCPHTTAALTVNESADPSVRDDVNRALAAMVPDIPFRHAEGNSPSHLRSALMGPSLVLPVRGGRLELGTWQGVYFCEFDGPRSRSVWVYQLGS
jgi:secondary thiamine-phosphate synthase enzyme